MLKKAAKQEYGLSPVGLNVTRDLCAFLAGFRFEDLPEAAVHQARRGVLDWIGCALAGSRHKNIEILLSVLRSAGSGGEASVFGHSVKLGGLEAATANGQMGHLFDYDDTHMGGVILHASSPILPALFALAESGSFDGRALIGAYAAGFEAGVRVGQAAPAHHDGGWHLTGTLGSIAAGAASARLLGLDSTPTIHAIALAATQAGGMQQNRGTSAKSFHAGKAASNGMLAALLAQAGFDASHEIIEGNYGFCRIYSTVAKPEAVTEALGSRWEIVNNGYKPYACGVVLHPAIDAMVALGRRVPPAATQVARIELRVHPHVVKITGVQEPTTGLQSKFSIYHSAAAAYLDGTAGLAQYTDARALAPEVVALRKKVVVTTDEDLRRDEAHAALVTESGERHETHIAHASGTIDNPMSDAAIEAKFLANAAPVIGAERAGEIVQACWRLENLADVRVLPAKAALPS
ncbi:MAG: MmgE/PrpD family protein [Sphingomicrobium sp.]